MIQIWQGLITLLAPLSHNSDENMGVDTKFRRIKIIVDGKPQLIPVYSGNAYRGKLRRLAALDFLERIGITLHGDSKISDKLYYTLFSGGSLQKGSTSRGKLDVGLKRKIREHVPFLSLFGAAVSNQMLPGKLSVGIATPIATETGGGEITDLSVWDHAQEIFYSRRDDLEDKGLGRSDPQQMRYTVECLSPGVQLTHEFVLRHATDLEASCFGAIMRKFEADPVLGGKSGVGHGKVQTAYSPEWPSEGLYCDWLNDNKGKSEEFLREVENTI